MKRRLILAPCFVLFLTSSLVAQEPLTVIPTTPQFFSRYDFRLSAAALSVDDPRFSWDIYFGGDIDVFDYVVGRTSTIIDYETVLGSEFRAFDPNQANYILEVSSSYRIGKTEVAGVFHHVSRHLSDRPKRFAIAWNILGVRVLRRATFGKVSIDVDADAGWATQHANVDYAWAANADLGIRRQVSPRVGLFARGSSHLIGVHSGPASRHTQSGGAGEAGVRLDGKAGGAEFFVGFERRVDADPLDFGAQRWFMVGFRLLRR